MKKDVHELFTRFFEEPTRESLAKLLTSHFGEMDYLDFKEQWPAYPDVARHMLALANSGGGAILLGVREDDGVLLSVGLDEIRDKSDVDKGLRGFFPPSLEYLPLDFQYRAPEYGELNGKTFQVIIIESDDRKIPYQATRDGDGVKANAIYVRRGTQSCEADHGELERLLNRRIESGYSSSNVLELEEHLEQLKVLYGELSQYSYTSLFGAAFEEIRRPIMAISQPNPHYPKQSYEEYIANLIKNKKRRIEHLLELEG